jgi:UDP-N-acetylmuramoylalanine--D-glutamate ligase
VDVTPLVEALAARARGVVTVGTSGPWLASRLEGRVPLLPGGPTMESAVRAAASLARPGDMVLLSPGYSSLDQYLSFAERGDRFRAAVNGLRVP